MDNNMPILIYLRRYTSYFLALVFMTSAHLGYSASYVPQSDQSIVASWTVPQPAAQPKVFIAQLISDASKPGLASRYYGRTSALLKPLLLAAPNDLELQFYSATVLQHYHEFDQAQQLLSQILDLQPDHVGAWLMKANIHMVQGDLVAAKRACLQVLGQGSLLLSTACVLEVNAEQGQVAQSYQQLQRVVNMAGNIPREQHVWLKQILADLAQRQQLPEQAIQHLSDFPLAQAPVSYLALWADIHLEQQQGHIVLDKLGPIVLASDSFDDALLLRLALAEQADNSARNLASSSASNSTSNLDKKVWQQRLSQRIEIRLQRNDTAHAADIARYYLDIAPDAIKALHWAKINWQQAKLGPDKRLLDRAMAKQNSSKSATQA
ncbi:lipopolysaccharide assembly protein LapB [Colwellia sp. MB02u-10]|uniref:tetratricopeptide repeat protein n=1 Tax=Colwellia sp. MB02u-10 TaxID=2759828 RepID=UPI001C712098|nr:tetratricopeptide repeat protein [Colwellia sp. MB02u-10]